jgi:hypothetical protein
LLQAGAIGIGELRVAAGLPEQLPDEGDLASNQQQVDKPIATSTKPGSGVSQP